MNINASNFKEKLHLRGLLILILSIGLIVLAWIVKHGHYYTASSDIGYYMGLVGSLMMLVMLTYPLRKRVKFMKNWGATKGWFKFHMILGILGPILVVFHCAFRLSSINAAVALFSMLLVASSGIIGRFVYRHIHQGLYGRRTSLKEVKSEVTELHEKIAAIPQSVVVMREIHAFESYAFKKEKYALATAWKFFAMPFVRQGAAKRCVKTLSVLDKAGAMPIGALVANYLFEIERVSKFHTYERIFSLWHVLHIPLVYLLVATAIFHVIAVHMY
jgi:hypothetical protein